MISLQEALEQVKGTKEESGIKKKISSVHEDWKQSGGNAKLKELNATLIAIKKALKEFADSHSGKQ